MSLAIWNGSVSCSTGDHLACEPGKGKTSGKQSRGMTLGTPIEIRSLLPVPLLPRLPCDFQNGPISPNGVPAAAARVFRYHK